MKILHTADWHIGSHRGPEKEKINLRALDTEKCLEELVRVAKLEKPDLALVSGDVFDKAKLWEDRSHSEVLLARKIIIELAKSCGKVIVMRGTPNHDSIGAFMELQAHFEFIQNIKVITAPQVLQTEKFDIAVLPGFDRDLFRAKLPGLGKEEENEVIAAELSKAVIAMKAACTPGKKSILMTHYTVPGCNAESGQVMMLTQFEPVIPPEALISANFDLVALGHIHRPQALHNVPNCYYSGAINALNFNDEGQERGFWIHEENQFGGWSSTFHKTPFREFITYHLSDTDITAINSGDIDIVAENYWRSDGSAKDKIVRILYSCSFENSRALNTNQIENALYADGAFFVFDVLPEQVAEEANKTDLAKTTDPEENLLKWLTEKQYPEDQIQELILKARPIMAKAEASATTEANTGVFEPLEIEVRNYRNYEEEKFNFRDISFCTINGQNGAGKSSLFMDAIIDCLFEEPREGELTGWIRNDENAKSGSIMFTFRIGEKTYRVTRTRARSGKGTLNLSELVDGEWQGRSKEKYKDTQDEIIKTIGMDSMTFKSCALIMQDQYGLFLQAPKEDRMAILGNLLGLGIYDSMLKIATDDRKEASTKARDIENEIEIHEATIRSYGNPEEEIEEKKVVLDGKTEESRRIAADRDAKKVELLSMEQAQDRCKKLSEAITTLKAKKAATEQNMKAQRQVEQDCEESLKNEETVRQMADRYRELHGRKTELAEANALYNAKFQELSRINSTISGMTENLFGAKTAIEDAQRKLADLENSSGDAEILEKAEEYKRLNVELGEMQEAALRYQRAEQEEKNAMNAVTETVKAIESANEMFASKKTLLDKDISLLSSDCGCIDIERANCKFLEKAKASKLQLQEEEEKLRARMETLNEELEKKRSVYSGLSEKRMSIQYDKIRHSDLILKCSELRRYVDAAERIKGKAQEAALVRANLENAMARHAEITERLEATKTGEMQLRKEVSELSKAFEESKDISEEMERLAPAISMESQYPVIRERLENAKTRIVELATLLIEQDEDIRTKELEYSSEFVKTMGMPDKKAELETLQNMLNGIEAQISGIQREIGALSQTIRHTEDLRNEIKDLMERHLAASNEASAYEILTKAFGQDGIPHQIVRSIVPRLADTANGILAQMTGGKTGLSFKTEKVNKSGKEKVALDVFIEDGGKSLPYLSKSGGEKVKASLSVILALAEIKSSSADIQLGMLFIDEPPFLDADGIQAYCDALETIQRRYSGIKIMAITHDPTMKARFPQNLDVIKTEHGSKVIF